MTYQFDGYNYLIRLAKGERLAEGFEQFFAATAIDGGWVNGLGAASDVCLGFYNLGSKAYKWRTFGNMMEIASLEGNIAKDGSGKLMFHLHGVFADDEYRAWGGHVKDLTAGATVELFIRPLRRPLTRTMNTEIGLPLLDLAGENG
jgi:predicted DNA-binding protein with PD1-like motif